MPIYTHDELNELKQQTLGIIDALKSSKEQRVVNNNHVIGFGPQLENVPEEHRINFIHLFSQVLNAHLNQILDICVDVVHDAFDKGIQESAALAKSFLEEMTKASAPPVAENGQYSQPEKENTMSENTVETAELTAEESAELNKAVEEEPAGEPVSTATASTQEVCAATTGDEETGEPSGAATAEASATSEG